MHPHNHSHGRLGMMRNPAHSRFDSSKAPSPHRSELLRAENFGSASTSLTVEKALMLKSPHTDTHRHTQTHTDLSNPKSTRAKMVHRRAGGRSGFHDKSLGAENPKQKVNLYSPAEAPRRCRGLGKRPVAPKQAVPIARVCEGLDCKSRASCEAGCDRFR